MRGHRSNPCETNQGYEQFSVLVPFPDAANPCFGVAIGVLARAFLDSPCRVSAVAEVGEALFGGKRQVTSALQVLLL